VISIIYHHFKVTNKSKDLYTSYVLCHYWVINMQQYDLRSAFEDEKYFDNFEKDRKMTINLIRNIKKIEFKENFDNLMEALHLYKLLDLSKLYAVQ